MKFYYTNPTSPESVQNRPNLSLGGYKSSIQVSNDDFNNLFADITEWTISENRDHYIALVLKNTTGVDITNVLLYFDYPESGCYSKLMVAAVDMVADSNGNLEMEHVDSIYAKPYVGEFFEADGESNAVNLGDIEDGGQIGIWIKRSLNLTNIQSDKTTLVEKDPQNSNRYVEVTKGTQDNIDIKVSWT